MSLLINNKITEQQLELLKSFKYLTDEKQISEVKELLNLYHSHKLDAAIEKEENNRNYSADVYKAWLQAKENDAQ